MASLKRMRFILCFLALSLGCAVPACSFAPPARPAPAVDEEPAVPPGTKQEKPELLGQPRRVLRISADPNNLPFTNERREGFENRIADLLAKDLNAELE